MDALLGISGFGSTFQCSILSSTDSSMWSGEERDLLMREETPGRTFQDVLKRFRGEGGVCSGGGAAPSFHPSAILWAAGPGSYTGLRITCSFVKGLAAAYRSPVYCYSFFELAWFLLHSSEDELLTIGVPLGRGRLVVATGRSPSHFQPDEWRVQEGVPSLARHDSSASKLFILQEEGGARSEKGEIRALHFGEALINLHRWKHRLGDHRQSDHRQSDQRLSDQRPVEPMSGGQLAALAPLYGQSFSALTLEQQRKSLGGQKKLTP